MKRVLSEFSVPGVFWVLILVGMGIYIGLSHPQLAYVVPILLGAASYLVNILAPPDSKARELAAIIRSITDVESARDLTPAEREQALAAQQAKADEIASHSKAGKILWG